MPSARRKTRKCKHTLEVLCALAFLGRLRDDLDRARGEGADDAFRLVLVRVRDDPNECLDLLLLLVDVRDEELLANAAADVGRSGRRVADVERLTGRARPLDRALLWRRLSTDGDDNARRAEFGLLPNARRRHPRI